MSGHMQITPTPVACDQLSRLPHTVYQGSCNGVYQAQAIVSGHGTAPGATRWSLAWMPDSSRTMSARRRPGLSRMFKTIVRVALTQLSCAHQFVIGRGWGAPRAWPTAVPSFPAARESSSVGPPCPTSFVGATGGLSASARPLSTATSEDAVGPRTIMLSASGSQLPACRPPCSPCLCGEIPVLILGPGGDYCRDWPKGGH